MNNFFPSIFGAEKGTLNLEEPPYTNLQTFLPLLLITNLVVSKRKQRLSKLSLAPTNGVIFGLPGSSLMMLRISEFVPYELKMGHCTVNGAEGAGSLQCATSMFARDQFHYFLMFALSGFRVTKLDSL